MRVIDPGHYYQITSYYPDPNKQVYWRDQEISFVKKIGENFPGNTGTAYPGTNCQELIRVLIDRVEYLNNQKPARENHKILYHLFEALAWFEIRAAHLKGTDFYLESGFETVEPCKICGHIFDHTHE
jgi:hypothetical protein